MSPIGLLVVTVGVFFAFHGHVSGAPTHDQIVPDEYTTRTYLVPVFVEFRKMFDSVFLPTPERPYDQSVDYLLSSMNKFLDQSETLRRMLFKEEVDLVRYFAEKLLLKGGYVADWGYHMLADDYKREVESAHNRCIEWRRDHLVQYVSARKQVGPIDQARDTPLETYIKSQIDEFDVDSHSGDESRQPEASVVEDTARYNVTAVANSMKELARIRSEAERLAEEADKYNDNSEDTYDFRRLTEMFTRLQLQLDSINSIDADVRHARKAVVDSIEAAIELLHARVKSNKARKHAQMTIQVWFLK